MDDPKTSDDEQRNTPDAPVGSDPDMAADGKTTIRLDDGLRADAQRCADARGIKLAEFVRQSVAHYVAWTNALEAPEKDEEPQR